MTPEAEWPAPAEKRAGLALTPGKARAGFQAEPEPAQKTERGPKWAEPGPLRKLEAAAQEGFGPGKLEALALEGPKQVA
jgi:hypothetical protein